MFSLSHKYDQLRTRGGPWVATHGMPIRSHRSISPVHISPNAPPPHSYHPVTSRDPSWMRAAKPPPQAHEPRVVYNNTKVEIVHAQAAQALATLRAADASMINTSAVLLLIASPRKRNSSSTHHLLAPNKWRTASPTLCLKSTRSSTPRKRAKLPSWWRDVGMFDQGPH